MNEDVILEEHKRLVRANHCNNHKVLTDILTNVNKCYLYGAKDYIKLMRNHIKALSAECEVDELFEDSKVEDNDIVFILTLNGREFYSIAQKLTKNTVVLYCKLSHHRAFLPSCWPKKEVLYLILIYPMLNFHFWQE